MQSSKVEVQNATEAKTTIKIKVVIFKSKFFFKDLNAKIMKIQDFFFERQANNFTKK